MERDQASKFVNDLLRLMVSRNGSDLFLTSDFPPAIKVEMCIRDSSSTGQAASRRDIRMSSVSSRHRWHGCTPLSIRARVTRATKLGCAMSCAEMLTLMLSAE